MTSALPPSYRPGSGDPSAGAIPAGFRPDRGVVPGPTGPGAVIPTMSEPRGNMPTYPMMPVMPAGDIRTRGDLLDGDYAIVLEKVAGKVYLALATRDMTFNGIDVRSQDPVVIKVTEHNAAQSARAEAYVIQHASQSHYLPRFVELREKDGKDWLVTRHITGTPLSDLIRMSGPNGMDPARAARLAMDVLQALKLLHGSSSASFVHRDIKPDNIIVTMETDDWEHAVLIDLETAIDPTRTLDGNIAYTLPWASPEHMNTKFLRWSSDIFSVGVCLYQMVTGRLPFGERGAMENKTMADFLRDRPDNDLVNRLNAVIRKSLNINQRDRYQSADEMLSALEWVLKAEGQHNNDWYGNGHPGIPPGPEPPADPEAVEMEAALKGICHQQTTKRRSESVAEEIRLRCRGEVFNAFSASRPLRVFSRCGGRRRLNFWLQKQLNAIAPFDLYDDEKRALTENSDLMPLALRATGLIRSARAGAAARVRSLNALLLGVLLFSTAAVVGLVLLIILLISSS